MDKSKSERLKAILSKKLTNEDIEEILKEDIQGVEKKNTQEETQLEKVKENEEKIEEEEKIETEDLDENLNLNEKEKKDFVIPSIRDEEVEEEKESNFLLYLVSITALLLVILTIYLFTKDNSTIEEKQFEKKVSQLKQVNEETKAETPKMKEIVKDEILKALDIEKTTQAEKNDEVVTLNKDEKVENIKEEPVENVLKEIETIEKKEKETAKEEVKVASEQKKEVTPEVKKEVIIKEKIVTKLLPLDKKSFKQYYYTSNFNTLKCYNFKEGSVLPDAQCKKDLKKFLEENKDAVRFQVIAVISEDDNIIYNKFKDNISGMEQSFQDRVKEYMNRGLGRERVLETSWQIKHILGNDVILTPTNYYVESKKNNKGIIIKAYY